MFSGDGRLLLPVQHTRKPNRYALRLLLLVARLLVQPSPRRTKQFGGIFDKLEGVEIVPPLEWGEFADLSPRAVFAVGSEALVRPFYLEESNGARAEESRSLFRALYALIGRDMVEESIKAERI